MPNNLTDAEIKKALECCYTSKGGCDECPYYSRKENRCIGDGDFFDLPNKILDLINRQEGEIKKLEKVEHYADKTIESLMVENNELQLEIKSYNAENEKLKAKNSNLTSDLTSLRNDLTSAQAEIERLKDFATSKCKDCAGCTSWKCDCANIKAEAYKECIEKVKKESFKINYCGSVYNVVDVDDLDDILNKLVGGKDG